MSNFRTSPLPSAISSLAVGFERQGSSPRMAGSSGSRTPTTAWDSRPLLLPRFATGAAARYAIRSRSCSASAFCRSPAATKTRMRGRGT